MENISYDKVISNIEQILNNAKPLRLNGQVRVNADQIRGELDQLRESIPSEVTRARQVINERKRIKANAEMAAAKAIEDANARANQILDEARNSAAAMVEESAIVRQAQGRANELSAAAAADTANLRAQAQAYKDETEARANKYYNDTLLKAQLDSAQLRLNASNYCKRIIHDFKSQIGESINYFSGVNSSLDGSEQRLESYISRFDAEIKNISAAMQQNGGVTEDGAEG